MLCASPPKDASYNETLTQSHLAGHFGKNWPGTEARPTYETLT